MNEELTYRKTSNCAEKMQVQILELYLENKG